jgi:hypothetical protein
MTGKLEKTGSEHPFMGLELACHLGKNHQVDHYGQDEHKAPELFAVVTQTETCEVFPSAAVS